MTATIEIGSRHPSFEALGQLLAFDEHAAISLLVQRETPKVLADLQVEEIMPKVCVAITGRADCWWRVSSLVREYAYELLLSP